MAQTSRKTPQNAPSRRRRARRYTIHYLMLFLFCLGLGLTLCFTVFFKVRTIKVKNCTFYSEEEVITRSEIRKGDNLFQINIGDTQRMLMDRFPYFERVKVKRFLPTTVIIDVVEEEPMVAAYTDEGYAVVSYTGKVLKTKIKSPPENICIALGLEHQRFTAGSYLYSQEENKRKKKEKVLDERVQMLQRFYDMAKANDFTNLTYVDVSNMGEIKALYDKRILIDFGGEIDLEKKIHFVQNVLERGIAENHPLSGYNNDNFQGTIDITNRKQLRTRALAVNTVWDERAFTVFEEDAHFFPDEDEPIPPQTDDPTADENNEESPPEDAPPQEPAPSQNPEQSQTGDPQEQPPEENGTSEDEP